MDGSLNIFVLQAFQTLLLASLPLLLPALVIGVVAGILQSVTSINEPIISFFPKLLGVFVCLLFFGGFMMGLITDFGMDIMDYIARLGHHG